MQVRALPPLHTGGTMDETRTKYWVVYEVAQRQHWPSGGYDDDGCYTGGGWSESDNYEHVVHAAATPELCRRAMNDFFERAKKRDSRMICKFEDGELVSSRSGNYNGGGYMSAYHHFEIRPAPRIEDRQY